MLEVPPDLSDNICMMNERAVTQIGKGSCRSDNWTIERHMTYNSKKIERVWRAIDMGEDCPEELELNKVEEAILYGDGGFMADGFENCMTRLAALAAGFTIECEGEEEYWVIGPRSSDVITAFFEFEKGMFQAGGSVQKSR